MLSVHTARITMADILWSNGIIRIVGPVILGAG